MMSSYLKENNVKVKNGTDVNSIMRDMMSIILEGALDQVQFAPSSGHWCVCQRPLGGAQRPPLIKVFR